LNRGAGDAGRWAASPACLEVNMLDNDKDKLDGMRTYIDGKMRRYTLLFSVNGGALAIAKLMIGTGTSCNAVLLGSLKLWHLALGSIIFTILIVLDNFLFAQRMKKQFLGDLAFNVPGKMILLLIGVLIISAWLLAIIC
jgi:hypothetical protein